MLPDKANLLKQINSAIKEKWNKNYIDLFSKEDGFKPKGGTISQIRDKVLTSLSRNSATLKDLEERIEALECMNDQLIYFICFLVENLPDFVTKTLEENSESTSYLNMRRKGNGIETGTVDKIQPAEEETPIPTKREKDVLDLLVKGFCAKEIAHLLFISESTVVTHKKKLKDKFHARNTMELISKAQPCYYR